MLLCACGGSEREQTPPEQVRDAVSSWFTTLGVETHCTRNVTRRFLSDVYGDEAACRRAEAPDPRSRPLAESVEQGKPALRGRRGTITVKLRGGLGNGAHGHVELAREGSRWRIDALGTDLLRETFTRTTIRQIQLTAERPGLQLVAAQKCVFDRFERFPGEQLRRMGYAAIGQRAGREGLIEPIIGCLNTPGTGPQGMSYVRWHLIDQALDAAPDGEAQQCIRSVLTKRLSDAEVLQHVKRQGRPTPATRKIARLVAGCVG